MTEAERPQSPEPTGQSEPMRRWERLVALVFGGAAAAAGAVSVFTDANQAGSAALVVVGAAMVLVGVQGTRLIRLGGSNASAEFEQRRVEQKIIEAIASEPDPKVAQGIAEGVRLVNPGLAPLANLALAYEAALLNALESIMGQGNVSRGGLDGGGDFVVSAPTGAVIVNLKLGSGPLAGDTVTEFRQLVDALGAAGGLLVTNMPVSTAAEGLSWVYRFDNRPVEVVTWTGPWAGIGEISQALRRIVQGRPTDPGGADVG